jgi:uncharacterized protein (DUF697 family)
MSESITNSIISFLSSVLLGIAAVLASLGSAHPVFAIIGFVVVAVFTIGLVLALAFVASEVSEASEQ